MPTGELEKIPRWFAKAETPSDVRAGRPEQKISTADQKPPLLNGAGGFFIESIPGAKPKGNTP